MHHARIAMKCLLEEAGHRGSVLCFFAAHDCSIRLFLTDELAAPR